MNRCLPASFGMVQQEQLRHLWLSAPVGRLCPWEQAKAVAWFRKRMRVERPAGAPWDETQAEWSQRARRAVSDPQEATGGPQTDCC